MKKLISVLIFLLLLLGIFSMLPTAAQASGSDFLLTDFNGNGILDVNNISFDNNGKKTIISPSGGIFALNGDVGWGHLKVSGGGSIPTGYDLLVIRVKFGGTDTTNLYIKIPIGGTLTELAGLADPEAPADFTEYVIPTSKFASGATYIDLEHWVGGTVTIDSISLRQSDEPAVADPSVFLVEDEYQILVPVKAECTMWVAVGGQSFYDQTDGALVCKAIVPQSVLNQAGKYTVHLQKTGSSEVSSQEISFKTPVSKSELNILQINDLHGHIDEAVSSARYSDDYDLLFLIGDAYDDDQNINEFYTPLIAAGRITRGSVPCVYARGNHEMDRPFAELWADYSPSYNGKSYYTFKYGDVWGIVLDSGQVVPDTDPGMLIACSEFRREQTELLNEVVDKGEYKDALFRLVVCHVPTSSGCISGDNGYDTPLTQADIDIHKYWNLKLKQVNPTLYHTGHEHWDALISPGVYGYVNPPSGSDVSDRVSYLTVHGLPCPMVMANSLHRYAWQEAHTALVHINEAVINVEFIDTNGRLDGSVRSCGRTDVGGNFDFEVEPFTPAALSTTFSPTPIPGMNSAVFADYPTVSAQGDKYQISLPVNAETTMWVVAGGKIFSDHSNGTLRSLSNIHTVTVPKALLDQAGSYTVYCRQVIKRQNWWSETGNIYSLTVDFEAPGESSTVIMRIDNLHALVNGEKVRVNDAQNLTPIFNQGGRTMVPFRFIATCFGAEVDWDEGLGSVIIDHNGKNIRIPIGLPYAYVNGVQTSINAPAEIMTFGRTFVPFRAVAELLDVNVEYDFDTMTIIASDGEIDIAKCVAEYDKLIG